MLNTFQEDDCCNDALIIAIGKNELEGAFVWMCPTCGETWNAQIFTTVTEVIGTQAVGTSIKHWAPVPMIEVLPV